MAMTVIFALIADLALALKVSKLNELGAAWVCPIDQSWTIGLNGTKQRHRVDIEGGMGADLEPFHIAVFYNGWLAGILTAHGGMLCAGTWGNEDNLIEALAERIERETGHPAESLQFEEREPS